MNTQTEYGLQVIITSGREACERAIVGFGLALAAAATGTQVVVWLSMRGAEWAVKTQGHQSDVAGFPSVAEYIGMIQEHGGRIELCSTCIGNACMLQGVGDGKGELRDGVQPVGLTTVAARMEQVPTVTF